MKQALLTVRIDDHTIFFQSYNKDQDDNFLIFSLQVFRYSLFKTLQDHDTLACGMVRKLRAKFPATMVNKKLTRGEVIQK